MPELSHGLFEKMRLVSGAKFYGHLTSSSAVSTKEKAPYRVLLARRPTFVKPGDTVVTNGAEVVILMDHPDDYPWAASFKAVYALEQFTWSRNTFVVDPVSKVKKDSGDTPLGKLYVNFDMAEELNTFGFQDTKYRFITGQDVQVGDKIDEYVVKRIVKSLGVKVVFVA